MEVLFHILIPVLILLALFPKINRKLVLMLLPLTFVSDFDFFLGHRFLFHNIFFVLLVSAAVYFLFEKKKLPLLIALIFLSSHLILDMSDPGVGLVYPIYDKLVAFNLVMSTSPADGRLAYSFIVKTQPLFEAVKDQEAPLITTNGTLILIFLAPIIIFVLYKSRKNSSKRGPQTKISKFFAR